MTHPKLLVELVGKSPKLSLSFVGEIVEAEVGYACLVAEGEHCRLRFKILDCIKIELLEHPEGFEVEFSNGLTMTVMTHPSVPAPS